MTESKSQAFIDLSGGDATDDTNPKAHSDDTQPKEPKQTSAKASEKSHVQLRYLSSLSLLTLEKVVPSTTEKSKIPPFDELFDFH